MRPWSQDQLVNESMELISHAVTGGQNTVPAKSASYVVSEVRLLRGDLLGARRDLASAEAEVQRLRAQIEEMRLGGSDVQWAAIEADGNPLTGSREHALLIARTREGVSVAHRLVFFGDWIKSAPVIAEQPSAVA